MCGACTHGRGVNRMEARSRHGSADEHTPHDDDEHPTRTHCAPMRSTTHRRCHWSRHTPPQPRYMYAAAAQVQQAHAQHAHTRRMRARACAQCALHTHTTRGACARTHTRHAQESHIFVQHPSCPAGMVSAVCVCVCVCVCEGVATTAVVCGGVLMCVIVVVQRMVKGAAGCCFVPHKQHATPPGRKEGSSTDDSGGRHWKVKT